MLHHILRRVIKSWVYSSKFIASLFDKSERLTYPIFDVLMSLLQLFELWSWLRMNVILLNGKLANIFHTWCARNFSNQAKLENCLFTTKRAKSRWTSCLSRLMLQILSSGEWYAYKTRSNADASHKGDETKHSQSQSSISCFSFNAICPRKLKAISCYCRL